MCLYRFALSQSDRQLTKFVKKRSTTYRAKAVPSLARPKGCSLFRAKQELVYIENNKMESTFYCSKEE